MNTAKAKKYEVIALVLVVLTAVIMSCATPSSPTGGPPDKQGPKIVNTHPKTGKTNFKDQKIGVDFSEFVNRSSLNEAIVIEPNIGIDYSLDWSRKSVEIVFDDPLPDSTTLIVTIDTEFKDYNGNKMAKPHKVAVSTGPEIDEGSLTGQVRNAKTGKGKDGERILLYREPVDLGNKANYIASTDTAGRFKFAYLREGKYKAFWLNDRNRNKKWDPKQERVQPFNDEFVELKEEESDTLGALYKTPVDTTKPILQGIGLFSSQRLRLRFSESIKQTDSSSIAVTDTMGKAFSSAYPLYRKPDEQFVLFGHSKKALDEKSSYRLNINGITDEAGNALESTEKVFKGSAQEDTTQQRIVEFGDLGGYFPQDSIAITYANPIQEAALTDSVVIIEGSEEKEDWAGISKSRNTLYISPQKKWKEGVDYQIRLWNPPKEDFKTLKPKIWHQSQLGKLTIITSDSTLSNIRIRISNEDSDVQRDTLFSGVVTVDKLPPLDYKVIAYQDKNDNGEWDFGEVDPFKAPEPYFIQRKVPVKERMTSDLTIRF